MSNVYDVAIKTPLQFAPKLSKQLNASMYFKREDLQPVFSFKIRGAYNKISQLTEAEKQRGVIAASAGNHAQGVALSAKNLGLSALIVMPQTTPSIKIEAVESYGAQVVLYGDNYSECAEHCAKLVESTGRTFIHPYDDPLVIEGQGTIGSEILDQLSGVTHIFVPVGGGGLITGIASLVKQTNPDVQVIAVEPDDAACLHKALKSKRRVVLSYVGIFADGVAVKQVGKQTFKLAKKYVDHSLTVTNDQVCAAIKSIFEDTRAIVEPAGALATAGAQKYAHEVGFKPGDKVVVINSGANMGFESLQYVTERTLIGSGRETLFSVQLPERPGALEHFCKILGKNTLTEFNYRQSDVNEAHILVGIMTAAHDNTQKLTKQLTDEGFTANDFSSNELAKSHARHMIGGKTGPQHERLVHFEFPERPGALSDFLKVLGQRWNISLFHYRGTGSDIGRVLIGFDVPTTETKRFNRFVKRVKYHSHEETDNLAYQTFLAAK